MINPFLISKYSLVLVLLCKPLLLSISGHALLDPCSARRRLSLELLLSQVEEVKSCVRCRDAGTLLEARALAEGKEPLLDVGELFNVETRPLCNRLLAPIISSAVECSATY